MPSKAQKARNAKKKQVLAAAKKGSQVHKCHLCGSSLAGTTMAEHRKRCSAVPKEGRKGRYGKQTRGCSTIYSAVGKLWCRCIFSRGICAIFRLPKTPGGTFQSKNKNYGAGREFTIKVCWVHKIMKRRN